MPVDVVSPSGLVRTWTNVVLSVVATVVLPTELVSCVIVIVVSPLPDSSVSSFPEVVLVVEFIVSAPEPSSFSVVVVVVGGGGVVVGAVVDVVVVVVVIIIWVVVFLVLISVNDVVTVVDVCGAVSPRSLFVLQM